MSLMQTAAGNVSNLEKLEANLLKKVKELDLDTMASAPDVEAQGVCSLTLQNYVDALRDADCMCLALDISRPEAAIAGAVTDNDMQLFPVGELLTCSNVQAFH